MNIYQFSVKDIYNREQSLEVYKGKVLLIVNTASKCGYTPQLEKMETLHNIYHKQGFEVLAFPSNDFLWQEPLTADGIQCNYGVTFPIMLKSHVRGRHQTPLYRYLSHKAMNGVLNMSPLWNFQKYLINRKGEVVKFYLPPVSPLSPRLIKDVERLLAEPA